MTSFRPRSLAARISGTVTRVDAAAEGPGRAGPSREWLIASPSPLRRDCGRSRESIVLSRCRYGRSAGLRARQSRSLLGSERDVVLHSSLHRLDLPEQLLQVVAALHEIDLGCIDDQERRPVVMKEEVIVRAVQLSDIGLRNLTL